MRVVDHERFSGVYWAKTATRRELVTRNLAPGVSVYGERLLSWRGAEYRAWNPFRSKLASAILNGVSEIFIRPGSRVLYLGVATGTTASHISDIVGSQGIVFGVDFSPSAMSQFRRKLSMFRPNVVPVLADARDPTKYSSLVGNVNVVYCDVAQPTQAAILGDNAETMLRRGGHTVLALKARSIDSVASPSKLFNREVRILKDRGFEIVERISLEPYEKDHVMVTARFPG